MAESKIIKQISEWVTVWTNPNPDSAFANNQTVSVNLSIYSELCFEFKLLASSTSNYRYYVTIPVVDATTILSTVGTSIYQRMGVVIDTDANTINLGNGAAIQPYDTRVESTSYTIPTRILAR